MKSLPNIEKSAFHHSEYVGWDNTASPATNRWRISRIGKQWYARRQGSPFSLIKARTLAEISTALMQS